jgi:hypothetical protein
MIQLLGSDFSIKIDKDNKIYNILKKFSGESVLIYANPEIKNTKSINTSTEKEMVTLQNEKIFAELYENYPELLDKENENVPVWVKLIENHVKQILGSETGTTHIEKIAQNKFKKNDLYLILPIAHFD